MGQVDSSRWLAYHPWGNYGEKKLKTFKNWELNYKAKLVSTEHINVALLHQAIAKSLRDEAGSIGYLIADDSTDLIGEDKEL